MPIAFTFHLLHLLQYYLKICYFHCMGNLEALSEIVYRSKDRKKYYNSENE